MNGCNAAGALMTSVGIAVLRTRARRKAACLLKASAGSASVANPTGITQQVHRWASVVHGLCVRRRCAVNASRIVGSA